MQRLINLSSGSAYGDGGLITTNDDQTAEAARMLRVHGAKERYKNLVLGYNSRLDAMQAAILKVKLRHIDQWNYQRQQVAETEIVTLTALKPKTNSA